MRDCVSKFSKSRIIFFLHPSIRGKNLSNRKQPAFRSIFIRHSLPPRPKQQLTTVMNAHRIPGNLERGCKKQSKRSCAFARPGLFSTTTTSFPRHLSFPPISLSEEFRSQFQVETTTFATAALSGMGRREIRAREMRAGGGGKRKYRREK